MAGKSILRAQVTLAVFLLTAAACTPHVRAADLLDVFQLAETNDPVYREAQAAYRATLETKPQALAQLLPLVSLNANTLSHNQDISTEGFSVATGEVDFNSHGYSLDITQPLFRADRFLTLRQAESIIQQAEAELTAALQDLILRVAVRYFLALGANDNLVFSAAEKKSLQRQLDQAKQQFEVGLTAITDVQEAQAGYDRAIANEILAINEVDNARERLREIAGEYLGDFATLGVDMPLIAPEPEDIDTWTAIALEQNLAIASAKESLETARQDIRIQTAGHLPTLDIVASRRYDASGGRFGATKIHDDAIGLELNIPLYEGGLVNSLTREARQRYEQALEQLEQQHRAAQRQTREAYLGVISGISQVQALKQALVSTETALQATTAGFELGTRTAVDVVAAERATLEAKRDYARARYDYLLNLLRLKQAAGTLSPDDLKQINSWLE